MTRLSQPPRRSPEAALHRAVAAFLRVALKPPTIWTTIGHGGGGRVRGAQLKAMGVQPGWPDILVIIPAPGQFPASRVIGLELKSKKGKASPEQKALANQLFDAGGWWFECRSIDEVRQSLESVSVPMRRTA